MRTVRDHRGRTHPDLVLEPGDYTIEVTAVGRHRDPKPGWSATYSLGLTSVERPLPAALAPLAEWFKAVGLADVFEAINLVDYADLRPSDYSPGDVKAVRALFSAALDRGEHQRKKGRSALASWLLAKRGTESAIPYENYPTYFDGEREYKQLTDGHIAEKLWSSAPLMRIPERHALRKSLEGLKYHHIPRYYVRLGMYFHAHDIVSRSALEELEDKFKRMHGIAFWSRVIRKISLAVGASPGDIVISLPIGCTGNLVFEAEPGLAMRTGSHECRAGMDSVELSPGLSALLRKAVTPVSLRAKNDRANFPAAVAAYLLDVLPPEADVTYVTREENIVEVHIRGLKGHVVHGGPRRG